MENWPPHVHVQAYNTSPPHTHTLKKQECTSNNLPSYHYAPPPSTSISLKDFSIVAFLEDTSGPNHKIPLMIHSLTG